MTARSDYIATHRRKLRRQSEAIAQWELRVAGRHDTEREQYEARLAELRASEQEVQRRLQDAEQCRADHAWEGLRLAVEDASRSFSRAFDAVSEFFGDANRRT